MLMLSTLLLGQLLAVIVWQLLRLFTNAPGNNKLRNNGPRREAPALGFRVCRSLIDTIVLHLGCLMPSAYLQAVSARLRHAGVEYSLDAEQFVAAKCISLLFALLLAACLIAVSGKAMGLICLPAALLGWRYPDSWLARKTRIRQRAILKTLPFYLDVITLSLESGSNLTSGLMQAVQKTPDSPLRREISRVLREIRSGKVRAEALRDFAERVADPVVINIVSGLIQAEKSGASLGAMLRAQARQLRSQRFQAAEKQAMEAPVKLLAPLFLFIFPTTFVVLGFLIVSKAIREGVLTWAPLLWVYYWPGVQG